MSHPSGTIAVLTHETGRYALVYESLLQLRHPGARIIPFRGADIARIRNLALEAALGDWVWFMDDDHAWDDPDLLLHLLDRQVDIVQPVVVRRLPPFAPVVSVQEPTGAHRGADLYELGTSGCVEVASCGMGGTLIRRHVWEGLDERPWFRVGELAPDKLGEDVGFTRRARAAGFKVYVDLDHPIDHCRAVRLRPKVDAEGQWVTALILDEIEYHVPAPRVRHEHPRADSAVAR